MKASSGTWPARLRVTPVASRLEPVGQRGVARIGKLFLGFLVGMWWV